jgi:transcriptional regulator
MPAPKTDVIQGTLDMLILKTLSLAPLHGFGIARRIEQISRDVFKVNPGSLLTALQRLERAGLVDAEWRSTDSARRARYYALTRAGRRRLDAETSDWKRRQPRVERLECPVPTYRLGTPKGLSLSSWMDLTRAQLIKDPPR